jgi:HK97 family phage portal protein
VGFWRDLFGRRSTSDGYEVATAENWDSLSREQRAILPWNVYGDEDAGIRTNSGNYVNEHNAFRFGIVYAAITLIADGIASLAPMAFNLQQDGTKIRADIPQWIRKPHPEIRRFDIWNQIIISVLAWGNGYAQFIRRPSDGVIVGLTVLDPAEVECEWDPYKPGYRRYRLNGSGPWLSSADIFHVQGPTLPGDVKGMSVIGYAREAIGLGMTLEEYGARYFGQGSQAKVVIEIPNGVNENQAKDIVKTFERFHKGRNNWHRPAIISGGGKLQTISIPPDDAQFLQSREHQAIDVARWFRVPPHRVGIVSASTSWGSGLAEENMAMLQHTYRPWIQRMQDALTMYTPGGQDLGTIIELDPSDLLKGTFKEQSDVFLSLYSGQVITKNEVRRALGYEPVSGGDEFLDPAKQAADAQAAAMANHPPPAQASTPPNPRTKEDDRKRKQDEAAGRSIEDDEWEERFNKNHSKENGEFSSGSGGMSPATPERLTQFKAKVGRSIPPAWTDVHIADDLDHSKLLCQGKDGKGRRQAIYSAKHTEGQAAIKFQRVKELSKHTDKLDFALKRDAATNDEAGALTLIRHLGMRPGSNSNTGASVQAHGATNLLAKHVTINGGTATLDFTGKDGVHIVLKTKHPEVVGVLKSRKAVHSRNERLFQTNETRVRDYMHEAGVPNEFMLKDLRTLHANTVALREVQKMRPPKTKTEFVKARRAVATQVSAELGNTPVMALGSYINPTAFSKWVKDPSWVS